MAAIRRIHAPFPLQRVTSGFIPDRYLTLTFPPVLVTICLTLGAQAGWELLLDDGDLYGAYAELQDSALSEPRNAWVHYRLAWVANRLELPDEALEPALAAWELEPSNQWYMAEYLRALRDLGMYGEIVEAGASLRGGGTCRYYLAVAERELGMDPSPSMVYLSEACSSSSDSVAADACAWTVILLRGSLPADSVTALLRKAVEAVPSSSFYRGLLAEDLVSSGHLEAAREQLHLMRMSGFTGYGYWTALAELAEAENDTARRIWALERARATRDCPAARRDLGWALYIGGRDAAGEGETILATELLGRAISLDCPGEDFHTRADSLVRLLDEYQERTAPDG